MLVNVVRRPFEGLDSQHTTDLDCANRLRGEIQYSTGTKPTTIKTLLIKMGTVHKNVAGVIKSKLMKQCFLPMMMKNVAYCFFNFL